MPSYFQVLATRCVAVITVLLAFSSLSFAQKGKHTEGREEVEKNLEAKYKLSTFTPGRGTIQAGSFLLIQKNGLEMIAATGGFGIPNAVLSYKDGRLTKTAKTMFVKDRLVPFPFGTALIVTKIEAAESHVAFDVVSADALEGTYYKASIHFDFGKGYLDPPDMNRINGAVASLFTIEKQEGAQQGGQGGPPPPQGGQGGAPQAGRGGPPQYQQPPPQQQQQQQQQQPAAPPPPPEPPPPPPPPAAPVEIKMGMTGDQVKAALGKPSNMTKFGTKEIYAYPTMKVTLVNGKVTNVE